MYHFIHSFVEETFIDAIRVEHTERIHNSCKRKHSPTPFRYAHFILSISAEVVKSTADPKSIKGLQISKPVFQVRKSIIVWIVIFKGLKFCVIKNTLLIWNFCGFLFSLVLNSCTVCVCYVIVIPTESTNWYSYGYIIHLHACMGRFPFLHNTEECCYIQ